MKKQDSQLSGQGARYNISGLGTAGSTHVHLKGRHPGTNISKSRCLVTVTGNTISHKQSQHRHRHRQINRNPFLFCLALYQIDSLQSGYIRPHANHCLFFCFSSALLCFVSPCLISSQGASHPCPPILSTSGYESAEFKFLFLALALAVPVRATSSK